MSARQPVRDAVFSGALVALAGCVTSKAEPEREIWVNPKRSYATFDAQGRPTGNGTLGDQVWGDTPAQDPAPQDPATPAGTDPAAEQDPEQQLREARRREAQLRTTFGDAVIIGSDGRLTKNYNLAGQSGDAFLALLTPFGTKPDALKAEVSKGAQYGGSQVNSVLGKMLGPDHEVEVVLLPDFWQVENMSFPKIPTQEQATPKPTTKANSLLLVTAQPSALLAFERALNLFFADLPQVEIEVKVAEFQMADTLSIAVAPNGNSPTLQNLSTGQLVQQITSDFLLLPPAIGGVPSDTENNLGTFVIGGIHDGWELNAVISALATEGKVDVKSYPKLVVQNGGLATVSTQTSLPFPKARFANNANVAADIQFKDVGVVMHIRPEIAGTDSVNLLINASVSAVTGFADTEPVDTPIVATRAVSTSVHLADGKGLAIGGLLSRQNLESESKIPILGDIPLIGLLFRSTTVQNTETTVVFTITPRIMRGQRGRRASPLGF